MVNKELIERKRQNRLDKINHLIGDCKERFIEMSVWLDQNAKPTTNAKMLAEVGFGLTIITKTNWRDWVDGLGEIGVRVIDYKGLSDSEMVERLSKVISEQIPECWGGPDMQEYVSFGQFEKEESNV
jgi:hypothetical protein